ncbi:MULTISPECIES: YfiT family bacillithiol transferase [unclassified Sphingobacterium]|uniref:YfiT family bacillithiol transferase n=1 Tax=unclassified Sphingobacterium TaxID=2609468 RepID=UPI0025F9D200|nr:MULTISPECIES: putative metal-dependent hydrolase [unclassified Sphingobacterium]
MQHELEKLRYPIGRFAIPDAIDNTLLNDWIKTITDFPTRLKSEVGDLTDDMLEKRYRPDGWTIRQVVHHCADSHMNSFIRFKLALTEEDPTIKLYEEKLWADLPDAKIIPIESSVKLLEGLHERWGILLKSLTNEQLERGFIHPATKRLISLKVNIGLYAWHCNHHLMHIANAKNH